MRARLLVPFLGTALGCDDHLFPAAGSSDDCTPTWEGVNDFFADNCLMCHAAPATSGRGIILPDAIEEDLANLTTPLYPEYGGELVVPGLRDASVLWQAVSHTGTDDVVNMPIGPSEPVPGFECIGTWIDDGALLAEPVPTGTTP